MRYNCPQLTQDLQELKEFFSVLKNQLAEFEAVNSSPEVSRAEKIAKLKELYQIRKKLQEIYPPLEIMKVWAEKYLTTHKTSRKIAQTQEQALTGKYLFYLHTIDLDYLESAEGLKLPKIMYGSLYLISLTSAEHLNLPDAIGGTIVLNSLTSAKHLKLPNAIGGGLNLRSLTSAEYLKLPDAIGGGLNLRSLTSAEHLKLPSTVGGLLDLFNLTSAEYLDLTNLKIHLSVYLNSLPLNEFNKLKKQYPNLRLKR